MPGAVGKKALLIIAKNLFRDEEYQEPRRILESQGIEVTVASVIPGVCRGKLGLTVNAELGLEEVKVTDYDIVAFIGGAGAADYFDEEKAHAIARDALAAGKVLGAICIAPGILARAGLLDHKRATAFESESETLKKHGAEYTGMPVESDGQIITANGPDAASGFGSALAEAIVKTSISST